VSAENELIAFRESLGIANQHAGHMADSVAEAKRAADATKAVAEAMNAANAIARENVTATRRAWLSIERVTLRPGTIVKENAGFFEVEIVIRNFGETPALSAMISVKTCPNGGPTRRINALAHSCRESVMAMDPRVGTTVFPQNVWPQRFKLRQTTEPGESYKLTLATGEFWNVAFPVAVSYRIVGDSARHITYRCFDITVPTGRTIGRDEEWTLNPGPLSVDEID
jgi:hypothetical protein